MMSNALLQTQPSAEPSGFFERVHDRASLVTELDLLLRERFMERKEDELRFDERTLKRLLQPTRRAAYYTTFQVPKRTGGFRTIQAPASRLKSVQQALAVEIERVIRPHLARTTVGFVGGRSIVDGAREHTRRRYVFNTDLADFFGSIELHRVKACLKLAPFNLGSTPEREEVAFWLANLVTLPMEVLRPDEHGGLKPTLRPVLPQGAATSPTLTNVVCQRLDKRLTGLARRFGLRYSRYADDLTFSADHDVFARGSSFRQKLDAVIVAEGFRQNPKKVRVQRWTERQMVTGLVVNERVNVTSGYVKQIRGWLQLWETEGFDAAQAAFDAHRASRGARAADLGHPTAARGSNIANVLAGKIDFLRMVDGGAVSHFTGVPKQDIDAGVVPFTEVSQRHTKLNGWLTSLMNQTVANYVAKGQ